MKRVFITGINRGLGRELFTQFAAKDYFVYGLLRNSIEAEKINKNAPKNTQIIVSELTCDESIKSIQESVKNDPIDLLFNNAGIAGKEHLIEKTSSSEINELFNIHCLGVFRTIKALNTNLLKSPNPIVINLNSRLGSITRQDNGTYKDLTVSYSYRIAKAAQNMLTTCLRSEFKNKIQFISLHPGKMKTEIAQVDADISPKEVAKRMIKSFENNEIKEKDGIITLGKEIIEW